MIDREHVRDGGNVGSAVIQGRRDLAEEEWAETT
jgi:hypothetical protein